MKLEEYPTIKNEAARVKISLKNTSNFIYGIIDRFPKRTLAKKHHTRESWCVNFLQDGEIEVKVIALRDIFWIWIV